MNTHVRHRNPPDPMWPFYKSSSARIREDEAFRAKMRDRAAYIFVTGIFPSHLRPETVQALRPMTKRFRRPPSLDGRSGWAMLHDDVVENLEINLHPMVQKVREKIAEGYLIQPSLGYGTRRNFSKIYMFKLNADKVPYGRITINGDASVKEGW